MPATPDQRHVLVELYDRALPDVYGYLAARCGSASVAEDLTSETFLAAVDAVRRQAVPELSVAWLIGVARHKLVDHWRRRERDERVAHADPARRPTTGTSSSMGSSPTRHWRRSAPTTAAR